MPERRRNMPGGISGLYHGTKGSQEGQIKDLREENEKLKEEIACMKEMLEEDNHALKHNAEHTQYLNGMIDGLRYAIRCNGISGAEVKY